MYRSFRKQLSNEDVMSFTPPGFKYSIDVQFPRRWLPVCDSCKKKSKTRENCRARDCHTALPWTDTYVCISLDDSCIGKDGKILDGPFVAKTTKPTAFNLKGNVDPMTPVCGICKEKNYTRGYCRRKKKHRQLPYNTVYVITSLKQDEMPEQDDNAGESVIVDYIAGIPVGVNTNDDAIDDTTGETISVDYIADIPVGINTDDDVIADDGGDNFRDHNKQPSNPRVTNIDNPIKDKDNTAHESGTGCEEARDNFQDINGVEASKLDNIPRSRTFLVSVSSRNLRFEWVDIDPDFMTQLQISHEKSAMCMNNMSEKSILNERDMHATDRTISEVDKSEITGINSEATKNPHISNNASIPKEKVSRLVANDGSIQPVVESQMVDNQMARLGAQEMISHENLTSQIEFQRRMGQEMGHLHQIVHTDHRNQMAASKQHQMQTGRRIGVNPFIAHSMMGGMPPYTMGVRDYASSRDTMEYDPHVHLPFVRGRMPVPGVEFNQMIRQSESSHQVLPGGANTMEICSNLFGMPNVPSVARSNRHRIPRHVSGQDTSTTTRQNAEGDSARDWTYGPSDNRTW